MAKIILEQCSTDHSLVYIFIDVHRLGLDGSPFETGVLHVLVDRKPTTLGQFLVHPHICAEGACACGCVKPNTSQTLK